METLPTGPAPLSPRRQRVTRVIVALSALSVVLALAASPHSALDKAARVGYAICHQIPERSFFLHGRQLPLCARCTGTFLGAVLGLAAVLLCRRGRASRLPAAPALGVLLLFMCVWAFDGANSYLTFFPGAPHLYEPKNWLRLATGFLNGLALTGIVFPVFNYTIWQNPSSERVVKNVGELVVLLPVVALLVVVIQAEVGWLLYPLALLSSLGVVLLLTLINSLIAAVALGREAYAASARQALVPLGVGLALAVVEIVAMGLLRDALTRAFGLPF